MPFVLSYGPSHLPVPAPLEPLDALDRCEKFWRDWTATTKTGGRYAEAIKRSLITLKALTYLPSGGIVAAPTTSLPEQFGSERNWDYRLCWVRDATLTLLAMMNAGIYDEAAAWRDWLQRAVAGSPGEMQIMYGVMGERRLTEWEVDWLPGYADSKPVRIGNAAHEQFQLDVYGELMDAFEQSRKGGLAATEEGWELQRALADHVAKVWDTPDQGLWETRGPPRHFVYSKVMAWVVFDRAVKAVRAHGLKGPAEEWEKLCERIHAEICDKGFDKMRNTFRAAYDGDDLDASLLLVAQTGFVKPDDPRFVGTVEAIERELLVDGFVRRYHTHEVDDGLRPGEGAFLACSFWLADAYVSIGRREDAKAAVQAPARHPQRPRPARRGVRARSQAPAGQLPAGLQPRGADQHRLQPDARREAAQAARRRPEPGQGGHRQPTKGDAKNVAGPPGVSRREPSSRAR